MLTNLLKHLRVKNRDRLINSSLFIAGFICLSQGINEQTRGLAYFSSFFFYFLVRRLSFKQNLLIGFLMGAPYGYALLGWFIAFKYTILLVALVAHGLFFSTIFAFSSILFKKYPRSFFVHIFSFGTILFFIRAFFHYSPLAPYVESFLTVVNTSTIFDHLIPYFGTPTIDVIVLAIGCLLAQILIQFKAGKLSKHIYFYIVFFTILFALRFAQPFLPNTHSATSPSVKVALLQGDIDWSWEERLAYADDVIKYFMLETDAAAKKGARIVIWPEHAILADIFHKRPDLVKRLVNLSHRDNVVIVAGALEFMGDEPNPDGKWIGYDTSVVIDPNKRQLEAYRAVHPVSGNVKAGNKPVIFETKFGSFPVISCFEVAYHKFLADYSNQGKQVDFFIGIANIQVFLGTNGGKAIQDHIYRIAMENGKYFIYISNTGPSLVIDPNGNVKNRIPESTRKTLVVDVPMIRDTTFYSRYQLLPLLFSFSIGYLVMLVADRRKKD